MRRPGLANKVLIVIVLLLALAAVVGIILIGTQGDAIDALTQSSSDADDTIDDQKSGFADFLGDIGDIGSGGNDDSESDSTAESRLTSGSGASSSPEVPDGSGSYTIREGTDEETTVHVTDSRTDGPTVFVIGGMHGNERSGYRAANQVKNWDIAAGKLVVLPEANTVAIANNEREWAEGDLNRHFPAGSEPTSALAQAIWNEVERHDPDFLLDLHSSRGLWDRNMEHECAGGSIPESVGMAIFHTNAGGSDLRNKAETVRDHLNTQHWPDDLPDGWQFVAVGSGGDGTKPMLKHKVAADRDTPAVIFETFDKYEDCVDISTQTQWATAATRKFLELYGLKN